MIAANGVNRFSPLFQPTVKPTLIKKPVPTNPPKVRIYILCHTAAKLNHALTLYRDYYWAVPILMKYQDVTFENAFWKQLLEIKDEWIFCDMVGVLGFKAYMKINIIAVHNAIVSDKQGYHHFWANKLPLDSSHPHILPIMSDVCRDLSLVVPPRSFCNYFMCSPMRMVDFINWFEQTAKPVVMAHPLIMTNAKYKEGTMTSSQLMALCGVPYYPHVPFIFERLNMAFFLDYNNRLAPVIDTFQSYNYLNEVNAFMTHYEHIDLAINPKIEFRYFCFRYLKYARLWPIPDIAYGSPKEVVLIEYRKFPHIEFILRNAIHKLGISWSYTIVCGKLNYEYMKDLARSIHPNINIVCTPFLNLIPSMYSNMLATTEFWNNFNGKKILIMQEDTLIFRNNIDDFLEWDYIGAPWPKQQDDTPNAVGNGGFSLRTRQVMIDVINHISITDTPLPTHTAQYMASTGNTVLPEDVYFSKNIQDHALGRVASWDIARNFSTETQYNPDSFGGHNFWLKDPNWRERIYANNVIQFKLTTYMRNSHRGGWKSVLNSLNDYSILDKSAPNTLLSMVEEVYLWNKHDLRPTGPWCGFVHCTPKVTDAFKKCNLSDLIVNPLFLSDLKSCMVLFTLSDYITNFIKENISNPPKIVTLAHPVDPCAAMFTMEKYTANPDKHLLQVGQQLRNVSSIFKINPKGFKRLWLTGNPDMTRCIQLLRKESMNTINLDMVYYTKTFDEYDALLEKNIVFIDLYDSAANNTVLECIVRNTPVIVNRTPGVLEYLGAEYPLYFDTLNEVAGLLTIERIQAGHDYLCAMDKSRFSMDYFVKSFLAGIPCK